MVVWAEKSNYFSIGYLKGKVCIAYRSRYKIVFVIGRTGEGNLSSLLRGENDSKQSDEFQARSSERNLMNFYNPLMSI